jgi:hypothetical protein
MEGWGRTERGMEERTEQDQDTPEEGQQRMEQKEEIESEAIRTATTLKVAQRPELAWRGRGRTRRECGKRLRSREGRSEGRRTSRRGCSDAKGRDQDQASRITDHGSRAPGHRSRTKDCLAERELGEDRVIKDVRDVGEEGSEAKA